MSIWGRDLNTILHILLILIYISPWVQDIHPDKCKDFYILNGSQNKNKTGLLLANNKSKSIEMSVAYLTFNLTNKGQGGMGSIDLLLCWPLWWLKSLVQWGQAVQRKTPGASPKALVTVMAAIIDVSQNSIHVNHQAPKNGSYANFTLQLFTISQLNWLFWFFGFNNSWQLQFHLTV